MRLVLIEFVDYHEEVNLSDKMYILQFMKLKVVILSIQVQMILLVEKIVVKLKILFQSPLSYVRYYCVASVPITEQYIIIYKT